MQVEYDEVREWIRPGYPIFYGGNGLVSRGIRWGTSESWLPWRAQPVSHTGTGYRMKAWQDPDPDRYFMQSLEAVSGGVRPFRLSRRVAQYDGRIWIAPIADEIYEQLDLDALFQWVWDHDGAGYDHRGALQAGLDWILPDTPESYALMFCSEWSAGQLKAGRLFESQAALEAFRAAGMDLPESMSEVTPIDLARWPIYKACWQVAGPPAEIPGFGGGLG